MLENDYSLVECIHNGERTKIFNALDINSHQSVIIKTSATEFPSSSFIDHLYHEFTVGSSLNNSSTVKYLAFKTYPNQVAIVEQNDYLESLDKLIPKVGFDVKAFLNIALLLVEGLDLIHRSGVIHNNIMPHHILYDPEKNIIKYFNFSAALLINEPEIQRHRIQNINNKLAYISPEQTGRVDCCIDYRTDFYSLGVTFYYLLTGKLPFQGQDQMQLIHNHIARSPQPLYELKVEIPIIISDIIAKLLAKNPDERYQSCSGLKADLKQCSLFYHTGKKERLWFELGNHDTINSLFITKKLYGREREIKNFTNDLKHLDLNKVAVYQITGYAGTGKTALIEAIQPVLREKYKNFVSGKADQLNRNTAYSMIKQPFQELIRKILSESGDQINAWKEKLLQTLGCNGKIITDIIPELETLIGSQPPILNLGPIETRNRFNYIFLQFVQAFANNENSLALFLDDCQWADSASLELIQLIISNPNTYGLLFLIAYRDTEISNSHLLTKTLQLIKNAHITNYTINLLPLKQETVSQWIADILQSDAGKIKAFTDLVWEKTEGNPFFIKSFLNSLYSDQLLSICPNRTWQWDIESIKRLKVGDNVADFMANRIHQLPTIACQVLQKAACLGSSFSLKSLSLILQQTEIQTLNALQPVLCAGMLSKEGEWLRFIHDRVQEAAYALVPSDQIPCIHLQIGRLLIAYLTPKEIEEKLLDIVDHLNLGYSQIDSVDEKLNLIKMNISAAQKAKLSIAYQAAYNYMLIATELLLQLDDTWNAHYQLAFATSKEFIECAYLHGEITNADNACTRLLANAKTKLEKADILLTQLIYYTSSEKPLKDSLAIGIRALSLLGVSFSYNPNILTIWKEKLLVKWYLRNRAIADLISLPKATNAEKRLALKILLILNPLVYWSGNKKLMQLNQIKQVLLSLKFGNAPESACGYVGYGLVLVAHYNNLKLAYEFGKLGIALNERDGSLELKAKVFHVYALFIHPWKHHWKTHTAYAMQVINAGFKTGDLLYAGFSFYGMHKWDDLDLNTIIKKREQYLSLAKQANPQAMIDHIILPQQFYANLVGETYHHCSLSNTHFDETAYLAKWQDTQHNTFIALYHMAKLQLCYFYEDYLSAIKHVKAVDVVLDACLGNPETAEYCLYVFLTYSALYPTLSVRNKISAKRRLKQEYKRMKLWANFCPINFLHHRLLMEAEYARLCNKFSKAIQIYDQAIAAARRNEYVRYQALTNELAAKFYLLLKQPKTACIYMREAYYLYEKWGAKNKVKHLKENYSSILFTELDDMLSSLVVKPTYDIHSVMKASQAISKEININKLIISILQIMLENAGAQRCLSIAIKNDQLFVDREISIWNEKVINHHHDLPLSRAASLLPISIVNYTYNTKTLVLVNQGVSEDNFQFDPYLIEKKPCSLLCLPIIKQYKLIYIIYLENKLTNNIFTKNIINVLEVLAAQAAISLENALLYEELAQQDNARRNLEKELTHVSKLATAGEMISKIAHEINQPLNATLNYIEGCLERLRKDHISNKIIEALTHAAAQAERAGAIIHNLKNFLRKGKVQKTILSINDIIKEVIKLLDYKITASAIRIQLKLSDQIPPIKIDKIQIQQTILNILSNSIEALQECDKSERLIVLSTMKNSANNIEIVVQDTGPGISAEIRDQLFEPFKTTKADGMGVGLAISRSIIEAHNGQLIADFTYKHGAEFRIILPMDDNL